MPRPRPAAYLGVSGVISPIQQAALTDLAAGSGLTAHRTLLLGVKAVHKTQFLDVANKYGPAWYPVGADAFNQALTHEPRPLGILRVAQVYLDVNHVDDPDYRNAFIERLVTRGRGWLDAIQFDMLPWHTDPQVARFLEDLHDRHQLPILMQCHGPAMRHLGPDGAIAALDQLAPVIDYVLFDASHGTGTRLDTTALTPFVDAAYSSQALAHVGIAIAGGLDKAVVRDDLPDLLTRFPDLSWDAEGALHPADATGARPLHLPTVAEYFQASADLLTSPPRPTP